jgi:hypothetical protein
MASADVKVCDYPPCGKVATSVMTISGPAGKKTITLCEEHGSEVSRLVTRWQIPYTDRRVGCPD